MTCTTENTPYDSAMELLIHGGFDGLADAIKNPDEFGDEN